MNIYYICHGQPWAKRTDDNFDISVGSYCGTEACELVGLKLLHDLEHLGLNLGLYRYDGLGVLTKTPRENEKAKPLIANVFKKYGLKITIEVNQESVNYLDVNLNIKTGVYKPYLKDNNIPRYVNVGSNHPHV